MGGGRGGGGVVSTSVWGSIFPGLVLLLYSGSGWPDCYTYPGLGSIDYLLFLAGTNQRGGGNISPHFTAKKDSQKQKKRKKKERKKERKLAVRIAIASSLVHAFPTAYP